jgi:antitoxin component YwqK of YwqJK toxin-antitoxin module
MKYLLLLFLICFFTTDLLAQGDAPNAMDASGKKHGAWLVEYPEIGVTRYQGQFEHGVPVGTFFYYYESGEKSSEVTHLSGGKSLAKFFHKNGALMGEGEYLDQQKHGLWKFYDNQAILSSEEPYEHGKIDGVMKIYHLNGQLAAEIPYVDGLKNGPFKEYNTDGKVRVNGTYKDNTFDGAYEQFYDTGKKYITGTYASAVKQGNWIEYDEDGRIIVQQLYDKGKLIKEKIEPGYEKQEIKIDPDPKDIIPEEKLLEDFYKYGAPR